MLSDSFKDLSAPPHLEVKVDNGGCKMSLQVEALSTLPYVSAPR